MEDLNNKTDLQIQSVRDAVAAYTKLFGWTNAVNLNDAGLPPGGLVIAFLVTDGLVGSIGLLVADYEKIGATWQPVFFTNPTTPKLFTYAELSSVLSVHADINLENVMGTESKGWAIYDTITSREILNKALRWFGLPQIFDPFSFSGLDDDIAPLDTDLAPMET